MNRDQLEWLERALSWVTLIARTSYVPDPPALPSNSIVHFHVRIDCESLGFLGSAGFRSTGLERDAFTGLVDLGKQASAESGGGLGLDTATGRDVTCLEISAGGGLEDDAPVATATWGLNHHGEPSSGGPASWGRLLDALAPHVASVSNDEDRARLAWLRPWFGG